MLRRTSDVVLSVYFSRALAPLCKSQDRRQLHIEDNDKESQLFIKKLFIGKFNYRLFEFPNSESVGAEDLEVMTDSVTKFMTEGVDSRKIDEEAKIPESTLKTLGEMGLFGQQVPTEFGGLGLNATSVARLAEITGRDGAISTTLTAHQNFGLKGLLLAGTPEQKEKYLPRLASGADLAAFCLTEPGSGSDAQSIQTRAQLSEDGTHYRLSGGKIWISNGGIASIMTVFAKTESIGADGKRKDRITAFLVERNFGGVTNGPPEDKLGIRGSNTCSVNFDNTPVPVENVLGEVGQGFKLAMNILNSGRYSMGASAIGLAKVILKDSIEYATSRVQFDRPIGQFPLIKEKLARIASDIYAMESLTYLTAALADTCGELALSLESAAVKVFCSEALWRAADESLQIYGGLGYTKDYQQERFLRDARAGLLFGGTNEILRMTIAGSGMKFAGLLQVSDLRQLREPKKNPFFGYRRGLEMTNCRNRPSDPKVSQMVHPILANHVTTIAKRANFFRYLVPEMLVIHGHETIEQQMLLRRVADVVIDLYMCCAVASRCSKALIEGSANIENEFDLATSALTSGVARAHANLMRIGLGQYTVSDEEDVQVADRLLRDGKYSAFHPLTRNW